MSTVDGTPDPNSRLMLQILEVLETFSGILMNAALQRRCAETDSSATTGEVDSASAVPGPDEILIRAQLRERMTSIMTRAAQEAEKIAREAFQEALPFGVVVQSWDTEGLPLIFSYTFGCPSQPVEEKRTELPI